MGATVAIFLPVPEKKSVCFRTKNTLGNGQKVAPSCLQWRPSMALSRKGGNPREVASLEYGSIAATRTVFGGNSSKVVEYR